MGVWISIKGKLDDLCLKSHVYRRPVLENWWASVRIQVSLPIQIDNDDWEVQFLSYFDFPPHKSI
jgi:hypothetical protein